MDLQHIGPGKLPDEINVVIEIPQGSSIKYELDKRSGALVVDRFLQTAMAYPFNYGFVPCTKADDGDPGDVLLLSAQPLLPGSVIAARPIGLLEMEDEAGNDEKIIAVPVERVDPSYAKVEDAGDLDAMTKEKIRHFFAHYKELENGKWVKIREFVGKTEAQSVLRQWANAAGATS